MQPPAADVVGTGMRIAIALVILSGVAHAGGGGGYGGTIGTTPRPATTDPHICCESPPHSGLLGGRHHVPITVVEAGPKPLARYLRWNVGDLNRSCFGRSGAERRVHGRLSIEFMLGFEGNPVQIRVWGLDDESNRCVEQDVARWKFDRYSLGWDEPKARVVAWVGYNDLPRYRTLRAWSRGSACAE